MDTLITCGNPPVYILEEKLKTGIGSHIFSVWACEETANRVAKELQWTNYGHVEQSGDPSFFQVRCFLLQPGDQ